MQIHTISKGNIRFLMWNLIILVAIFSFFSSLIINIPTTQAAVVNANNIRLSDSNNNGKIDRITFDIANGVLRTWATAGALPYGVSVTQNGNAIDISAVTVISPATNPAVVQVDLSEADPDLVVSTDGVNSNPIEFIYTPVTGNNACVNCIQDGVAIELGATPTGDAVPSNTEIDTAAPIVVSTTPAANAVGIINTTPVVIHFSEAMNTGFVFGTEYSSTPNPGNWGVADWTIDEDIVTLPHAAYGCLVSVAFTTDETEIVDQAVTPNALNTAATLDGDWSFTTKSCGTSGGGAGSSNVTTTPATYQVTLKSPNGGEILASGSVVPITWTTGGTGTMANYINLGYNTDGSNVYTTIVKNETNDGSYDWTVPDVYSDNVKLYIQYTDLAVALASDVSDKSFSIHNQLSNEPQTAPSSEKTGISPVTGQEENISEVSAGDYIKSPYFSTIYYIDSNLNRHPFPDSQTYFTWQPSFGSVKVVTDATLTTLSLGATMLPKPGVVLVKIQTDPKVYAIETNPDNAFIPTLRWIATESVAQSLYGASWQEYVIDLPVTLFNKFGYGANVNSTGDISVDSSIMKTRSWLNSQ